MVVDTDTIQHYFPELSSEQLDQLRKLGPLYKSLNQKVNVISRKDIDSLYLHHVLHSLSIAKYIRFKPDSLIVDVGTGGGFPGIPLAIFFPKCKFYMIDGTAKKIAVANEVIQQIGLENAIAKHQRSEELRMKFDFVVARAVTRLHKLIPLTFHLISNEQSNAVPNGLITLKGGDLTEEISEVASNYKVERTAISSYFSEEYFETKQIIYIQK